MRSKTILWIGIFLFMGLSLGMNAQGNLKKEANRYFKKKKFDVSLTYLNRIKKIDQNPELLFLAGICQYETNLVNKAIQSLERSLTLDSENPEAIFYLAKCYHAIDDFKEAASLYKQYLKDAQPKGTDRRKVIDRIKKCAHGIRFKYDTEIAYVENLGQFVNTVGDELNPVQSPNFGSKYYFSSERPESTGGLRDENGRSDVFFGNYKLDMYVTELSNGVWQFPMPMDPLLNSAKHDQLLDISRDGSMLLFLKSRDKKIGSILVDTFRVNKTTDALPKTLSSPMVGELGDIYVKSFGEDSYIFSSKRAGGYGGYDLYFVKIENGIWSEPVNLGPKVNTPYDEITPYVSLDGRTLYYSSNNNMSFGGYDVFRIRYNAEGQTWSSRENLGLPINSSGNDIYYSLAFDGNSGMLTSDRKSGYGGYDLYIAYLKKQNENQLIRSSSLVFADDYYNAIEMAEDSTSTTKVVNTNNDKSNTDGNNEPETKINRESFVINVSPLYYGVDDNVLTPVNTNLLGQIASMMNIYPELNISLTSHALKEGLPDFDLYFSMKRAEKVERYLTSNGVDPSRIDLIAAGSAYPIAKDNSGGQNANLGERLNRRIDIRINNIGDLPVYVSYEKPKVVNYLRDNSFEIFSTFMDGITFRIKISESAQIFKNEALRGFNDVLIIKENGLYFYTVGLYDDYYMARNEMNKLISQGFDASVIPCNDGLMMTDSEIIELSSQESELQKYQEDRQ